MIPRLFFTTQLQRSFSAANNSDVIRVCLNTVEKQHELSASRT